MRRILLWVTVAVVMALTMALGAGSAFAAFKCNPTANNTVCSGGEGSGVVLEPGLVGGGGGAQHATLDPETNDTLSYSVGGGQGGTLVEDPGGSGVHCDYSADSPLPSRCVGGGSR